VHPLHPHFVSLFLLCKHELCPHRPATVTRVLSLLSSFFREVVERERAVHNRSSSLLLDLIETAVSPEERLLFHLLHLNWEVLLDIPYAEKVRETVETLLCMTNKLSKGANAVVMGCSFTFQSVHEVEPQMLLDSILLVLFMSEYFS